ncbi:MAG: prohibitin family protein [Cytophagales bacterium]|nr:prohibitin family protein [Cytophagales bacterium]
MKKLITYIALALWCMQSCKIVNQDEVGVKRTLGKVRNNVYGPGPHFFNPFISTVITAPVRTVNLQINMILPSKEGLNINAEISILYKIKTEELPKIVTQIGFGFENELISPVFRSAAADICSKFDAKDMHSSKRSQIELQIKEQMMEILEPRGFIIERVMMKSILLPAGLTRAIEEKLQAEQDALRMEFIKDRERKDAERKQIQAEGDKQSRIIAAEGMKRTMELEAEGKANALKTEADAIMKANEMIYKSLNPVILKYKSIEALEQLAKSNNAKVIITDGKMQPLMNIDK